MLFFSCLVVWKVSMIILIDHHRGHGTLQDVQSLRLPKHPSCSMAPSGLFQSHAGQLHRSVFFLRRNVWRQTFHLYDPLLISHTSCLGMSCKKKNFARINFCENDSGRECEKATLGLLPYYGPVLIYSAHLPCHAHLPSLFGVLPVSEGQELLLLN